MLYFDTYESKQKSTNETVDLWSESTKVVDYLNQVRMKAIGELRQAQEVFQEHFRSF